MKIVECIHSLGPGGAERFLVDLCNELCEKHEIYLLVLNCSKEKLRNFYCPELSDRIHLIDLGYEGKSKPKYMLRLYKLIKNIKPDVVHVHCVLPFLFLTILLYHKCVYVQTLHNKAELGIPRYRKISKFLFSHKIVQLVTISQSNKQSFEKFFKLKNDKLIYNGRLMPHKTELFDLAQKEVESYKKHLNDKILLCVARCNVQKNIGLLVESVNKLSDEGNHVQLLIAGDCYDETDLGKKWQSMAGESVHFIGTRTNIADYFLLADAFCLSSLYEGMPITLIEAMACKCIPVSTPVSGIVDIIEDGKTGFVAKDFSLESYVQTLHHFMTDGQLIDRNLLFDKYLHNFSMKICAQRYIDLFTSKN